MQVVACLAVLVGVPLLPFLLVFLMGMAVRLSEVLRRLYPLVENPIVWYVETLTRVVRWAGKMEDQ